MTKIDVNTIGLLHDFCYSLSLWAIPGCLYQSFVQQFFFLMINRTISPLDFLSDIVSNWNVRPLLISSSSLTWFSSENIRLVLVFFDGNLIDRYFIAFIEKEKKEERRRIEACFTTRTKHSRTDPSCQGIRSFTLRFLRDIFFIFKLLMNTRMSMEKYFYVFFFIKERRTRQSSSSSSSSSPLLLFSSIEECLH